MVELGKGWRRCGVLAAGILAASRRTLELPGLKVARMLDKGSDRTVIESMFLVELRRFCWSIPPYSRKRCSLVQSLQSDFCSLKLIPWYFQQNLEVSDFLEGTLQGRWAQ